MPSSRPRQRFLDIIKNIDAVQRYVAGLDFAGFSQEEMRVDAVERCLSRISEAATKLGSMAEDLAPRQPWRDIRGLGNWLRHDYPEINHEIIWKTAVNDLPALRTDCEAAIAEIDRLGATGA
ncbi:MAG: DUF86 domain-containing protein [Hyphomicrobiaceae bacterium]